MAFEKTPTHKSQQIVFPKEKTSHFFLHLEALPHKVMQQLLLF